MNKFAILLTCCVSPLYCNKRECEIRKKLYLKVINKWLSETSFEIFCVDSSNYKFQEIDNPRFHACSFLYKTKDPSIGKTNGEVISILYIYKKLKTELKKYTHIIKITGRYYLKDLEKWTNKKRIQKSDRDLWTQQDKEISFFEFIRQFITGGWINSEIFICRLSKLEKIFLHKDTKIIMERHLYTTVNSKKYKCDKLPLLKNTLHSRRGGDNLLLKYL